MKKNNDNIFSTCTIVKRNDITTDLWKIWLNPLKPFKFEPGQYCTLGVKGIERPYSIVSSPNEDFLELFLELIPPPQGRLTPLLHDLSVGDSLTIRRKPKGLFKFQGQFKNHLMISTSTGVAPFVSMIRNFQNEPDSQKQIWVFEGVSYTDQFGYKQELEEISNQYDNIQFIPTCSRPNHTRNKGWNGITGRVNIALEEFIKNNPDLTSDNTFIYACGHPEMVSSIGEKFSDDFNFMQEKFWT